MKKIFVLVASLFLCTLFANAQNNVIDNELQKILNQKGNDYIDVNIMLKAQMTSDDFAVLNCKSDSKEVRREIVTNELKKFAEKSQKDIMSVLQAEERSKKVTDIQNFWIANFINCKAKADVIYQLASHPDVATISYNSVMEVVSDSKETESRDTRAVTATIGEHLTQIKAEKAWELGYTGKGVIVAVLDSGVNTEHADLKDHLWNGNAQHGYNVVNPGQNPIDDRSHGTHCAGIVCGDGTSGTMTGVAPDAQLMSIKLYDSNSGLTVDRLADGVEFAIEHGAHILNISQGWIGASDANRRTLRTMFENLLDEGIIAVVACGNDREYIATYPVPGNIRTPGDCPPPWLHPDQTTKGGVSSVVSVGAVGDDNNIVAISSQGPVEWDDYPYNPGMGLIRPDIVAPGTIRSLSNTSNDQYTTKGGTSQAAPCVAGVMALMLEKNPDLTPEDLCRIVETRATKKTATKDNLYGSGVVDALEAVRYADFDVNTAVLSPYAFSSKLDAGSNVSFELTLINNGKAATNGTTNVTISENDAYTTIIEGSKTYSTMAVDATESATFVVSFNQLIPDNYEVTFTVNTGSTPFDIVVTVYNELVAPTLTATANGTDINLSWNATNNATSYNIYRDGVFLENTTSTSYTDAGLEYGTIYAYNVTTKRNDLESEHSLTVRVQTVDNPAKPSPTYVVATNNGTNASVTWTNGAESKGSHIYRKDINASVETSIATNVNGDSYTDNTWNSLADGIYQYGVANLYAQNEKIYEEGFEGNTNWSMYYDGSGNANWKTNWKIATTSGASFGNYGPYNGQQAAFFTSTKEDLTCLSYLVSPQFDFTEHNGSTVKLSFYYRTPEWPNDPQCVNRLRVRIGTSPTGPWEETSLWSNNQVSVANWTKVEIDLSAYVNSTFYIAFENATMAGHCSAVDDINISIEGSAESRIEWSNIVGKNVNMFVQDGDWSNTDNWTAKRLPDENENVIIDANATVTSGNITVNSLVINEGKSLTLNNGVILTVTDDFVNNDVDAFIINDGAQVFQNNEDVSATFVMNISTPDEWSESNKTGWQFIASPLKYSKISDFVPSSSDYDLFKYDGTKELEWLNHKDETTYEVPTAPQNLLAEAISTSTIVLSWDAVVGASSYKVYFNETFISTASNTFEVTGLEPGKEYCYSVAAVNAHGESDKSEEACTKTITLAPQNLVATAKGSSSIELKWDAVIGAERYVVYKDSEVLAQFVTKTPYVVEGLTQATKYCFTVTAVNYLDGVNGKESAHSDEACATTDITIPSAPQNVVLVATSPYSVKLTWDPVAGADSYNIYFIAGGEAAIDVKATEYIFEGLTPGMGYCYNVTAVNTKGESQPSGSNSVNTPLPTPEAPQNLVATATGPATVELTWNSTTYAETYKVYDEDGLVFEGISSTTYTVYDLEAGEHCFTVIAVNAEGSESGTSNEACAIVTEQEQGPIAENVIIGDGNSSNSALPLNAFNAYSISQQIYTRAEIGQTGSIKAVSFKYKSGVTSSCTRTIKVYLKQTSQISFAGNTSWESMTDADEVFEGNITITDAPGEWVRINLNTPFEYTGNNLVVCVYDYTNRKEDNYIYFHTDELSETKSLYYAPYLANALDPENMNSKGSTSKHRNQIRFSFDTGAPEPPQNLLVRSTDETTIHLSWDPSDGATSYEIYLGNMGGDPIAYTNDTEYDVTGLEKGSTYCYAVKAVNAKGRSDYSVLECATAGDIQLETIPITFILRDNWGDGWNGNKLSVSYPKLEGTFNGTYTIDETTFDPYPYDDKKRYTYTFTLEIPKGYNVTLTYIKSNGANPATNENSFDVKCEDGTVLFSAAEGSLTGVDDVFTFIADCTPKAPNAPILAAVAKSSSTIALSWNEVLNATSYNVYQDGEKITTVTTTSYNVEGLNATTEYCFTVTAANEAGESDASEEECVMTEEVLKDIVVETGTDKNPIVSSNYNLPVHDFAAYSMSQQIYTAEELGGNVGKINSIAFKLGNSTSSTSRQYEVYITHTNLNTFNGYNFVAVSSTDKVFDGDVYISGTINTWYTINLEEPFNYTGGNIIVTVYDKTGYGLGNSGYHTFYRYTTSGRSLYKQGSSAYNMSSLGTGTSQSYTAQIQLAMSVNPYPTAPQNLVATAESSSSISLTWNAVGVATSYNVYSGAELVANVTGTTCTVQGLNPSTTYCYKVTSVNEFGESEASNEVCATTKMLPPSAPTNLVATSNGENSIVLTWSAATTATSYNVYQGGNSVATGVTGTSYTVEGLDAGTEYCFTVKAVNNGGESAASTEACAETDAFTGCYVTFTLKDKYGDGWNGNSLTVSYGTITKSLTVSSGKSLYEEILAIPQGANLTITYVKSQYNSWPEENSFSITYENGDVIIEKAEGTLSVTTTFEPFTISCTPEVPGKPELAAEPTGETTIELKMSAAGAETYNIYQEGAIIATGVTGDTYVVSGLSKNTEYCFTVVAVNEVGDSEMSDETCATTFAAGTAIVAVGEGNIAQMAAPVYNAADYNFSLSQQIYTQSEIGVMSGNIKGVSFHQAAGNNNVRDIIVYMQNVDKASFDGNYDWITFSDSDIVYQGTFNFGVAEDWVTIYLQNDFEYTGGNLAITVYDQTGTSYGYSYNICDKFYNSQINEWRGMYYTNANALNLANVSTFYGTKMNTGNWGTPANVNYINNIKLTIATSAAKSSSASAKMTDVKGGFDKVSAFGTSSGTELSKFESTFEQGIGYLASYETETTATFKGTLNHEKSYTFNLAAYDDSKNLANFNLLGNPFAFDMDWNKVTATNLVDGYAVVNEDGGYEYFTDGKIKVGDGFFVKATDANPSLTYNTRGNRNHEKVSSLNVISSSKAGDDNVIINLAGEQEGFPKIKNFNENIAVVYVTEDDMAYGIYNCNEDALEVELAFKVSNMGEYNIHIEPNGYFDYVTLVDLSNGSETNMLTSSYSFTAVPKENGKRFVLKFAKSEMPEGQDNFVYQSGKELIVETEGTVQIIDIMGRVIYSNEVTNDNNRIDISGLHSAAYIVRLINNDSVKTQKVVVY